MGKTKEFYMYGLTDDLKSPTHEGWVPLPPPLVDADRMIDEMCKAISNRLTEKLQQTVEGLVRQHEAEKAQMRAEFEAERARANADLVRSELEKEALQADLFDTKHDNGELSIENALLRRRLNVQPRQEFN